MDFEVIDFHTHPFLDASQNICSHKEYCGMGIEETRRDMLGLGVTKICGSVLHDFDDGEEITWAKIKALNDSALELWAAYGDFYVPGFHVHPDHVRESCEEIERMEGPRGVSRSGARLGQGSPTRVSSVRAGLRTPHGRTHLRRRVFGDRLGEGGGRLSARLHGDFQRVRLGLVVSCLPRVYGLVRRA